MSYQVTTDFRQGLDARKFFLALPPGALLKCNNAHITQGGEIEKRKAFVPVTIPAAFTGIHFGLQPGGSGIFIFGSTVLPQGTEASRARAANVATLIISTGGTRGFQTGDVVNISGVGGTGYNGNGITLLSATSSAGAGTRSQTITYTSVGAPEGTVVENTGTIVLQQSAQLPNPLIYEVLPNPGCSDVGTSPNMTGLISSTLFGNAPFALGQYDDGSTFPFYGLPEAVQLFQGAFVPGAAPALFDAYAGLQLGLYTTLDGNVGHSGEFILKNLAEYIAANVTDYTDNWSPGALHMDLFSIPTTLDGTPYTVTVTLQSALATMTAALQNTGTAAVAAVQAVGNFTIVSAGPGTQATGNLSAGANPSAGDTVTIGSVTYRFESSMSAPNDVKIGTDRWKTMASLASAINASGTPNVDYFAGTVKNPDILCTALTATGVGAAIVYLIAIAGGTAGNALALSTTSGSITASGSTLSGAVASQVTQIVVNGATNLLTGPVAFSTDEPTTAAAVVTAINSNGASGYVATSSGASINILPTAAGTASNGFSLQVQAQGTLVCGTGSFSLAGSGFTVDYCKANEVNLINIAVLPTFELVMTYPQGSTEVGATAFSQVLSDFCRAVANSINSGTGTHGYLAHCPTGGITVFIAKATTASTDKQAVLDVSVTPTATNTGTVVPGSTTPLSVTLTADAVVIPLGGKSASTTAQPVGGLAPYSYKWVAQSSTFVTSANGSSASVISNNPKAAQTTFSTVSSRKRTPGQTTQTPTNNQVQFVCVVTDALGEQATSEAVNVTVLAIGI